MNPAIVAILGVLLLCNTLIIYFTFNTWYGMKKRNKLIAYSIDKKGKITFDLEE